MKRGEVCNIFSLVTQVFITLEPSDNIIPMAIEINNAGTNLGFLTRRHETDLRGGAGGGQPPPRQPTSRKFLSGRPHPTRWGWTAATGKKINLKAMFLFVEECFVSSLLLHLMLM